MSRSYIGPALRRLVTVDARSRCGFCLTSARITGTPMEIDHIIPESLGGKTVRENLWLSCSMCNDCKSNRIASPDPDTGEIVRLFDPRRQIWTEHFCWNKDGDKIIGLTPTGRATVAALRMNRVELVEARRNWIVAGWHPPLD